MTVQILAAPGGAIGFGDFIAGLEALRFDGREEAAFVEAAPLLARLNRDRTFLGDMLIEELKGRAAGQERTNDYGPQVILLHRGPGWFIRANIWPDESEPVYRASGPRRFFYGVPHDHNFCFLTSGYSGPGYWSDYYEVDPSRLVGHSGEAAGLRFVERSRLSEGRMLLYRAHVDVHSQLPPDATSVSLNICEGTAGRGLIDQYRYDLERDTIAEQIASSPAEALIALLPSIGGEEGRDLLSSFAASHPCDRIRFGAIAALASDADLDGRVAAFERAAGDRNRRIAALARDRLETIAQGRPWIERSPSAPDQ